MTDNDQAIDFKLLMHLRHIQGQINDLDKDLKYFRRLEKALIIELGGNTQIDDIEARCQTSIHGPRPESPRGKRQ